ncbi:hypothetical protein BSKO_11355 [Bryopsis sp. KO-2023]|nr:hypothetical protein BSKO_11355 [Bryopsis sp. KO-2023]
MNSNVCEAHAEGCNCAKTWSSTQQSLDEVDFMRSACAAAKSGHIDRLRTILRKRPDAVDGDGVDGHSGYTPLHYASRSGHQDCVLLLLQSGADVDRRTTAGGATSLHRAAHMGHASIVNTLCAYKSDGSIQDFDGETPLHKALAQGHLDTARILIAKFPACLDLKDRYGKTARDMLNELENSNTDICSSN